MGEEVLKPIPRSKRVFKGIDVFLLWAGGNTCLATIFTGGIIGPKLGILYSIAIILIGSTIGGFLLGLVALLGERKGLPTMVLTRKVVTTRGSYIASILNAIQLIGWTSILLYASAEAAASAMETLLGETVLANTIVWVIVIGVVETVYTLIGPKRWVLCQRIAVTTLIVVLCYEAYALFNYMLSQPMSLTSPPSHADVLWGFDMVLATAVSWAPLVADYSRLAKSSLGAIIGTWWGYTTTSYVLYSIGTLAAVITGAYLGDPTQVAISLGLSAVVFIFIAISAVTTNLLNLYSAVVSTMNVFPKTSYGNLVIFFGTISTVLAAFPVFFIYFEEFLYYIGSVFVPLIAVLIIHYIYGKKKITTSRSAEIVGLISWIIGVLISGFVIENIGFGATIVALLTTACIDALLLTIISTK
ncbi:MAG: hypothetical protein DRN04_16080 [Thermoprotei archaeon]|nr:MAG: hypothetical protein DRN04_16080 [Thermoprotei archaeon]